MATRIMGPTGSRRRRRFLAVPILIVGLAAFFMIAGAQANPPQNSGLFELDKNAKNNVSTTFLGSLGGNINATVTSFTVCQASSTNPSPLPITIQVDAEQMTVGAIANAGGGGCSGTFKRTYSSVTRGVNSTTANSQQFPVVTVLPDGHFVVAWQEDIGAGDLNFLSISGNGSAGRRSVGPVRAGWRPHL